MSGNILDWTNAFPQGIWPSAGASRIEAIAAKLNLETTKGDGGTLPFLNLPHWPMLRGELEALKPQLAKFEHMVLLGIGGSALGARALQKAFLPGQDAPGHKGPWLWIADNIDAPALASWFAKLPPEKTVVVAVSKSGGTIETAAQYVLARQWLRGALGDKWTKHVMIVTGETGLMRQEAQANAIATLPVPTYLGGRYSALSAVGLLPAMFLGIDPGQLCQGALSVTGSLAGGGVTTKSLGDHPAWKLATWSWSLMSAGRGQLIFFTYIPHFSTFGAWFGQLWAESLGKEGKGSMPLPAVGVTDQHSLCQMFFDGPKDKGCLFVTCPKQEPGPAFPDDLPGAFSFLKGKHFGDLLQAESLGTHMALTKGGTPLVEIRLGSSDPVSAGALMGLLEATTLLTGWLLDINPLDQPAVEFGKRLANSRLGAPGLAEEKELLNAFLSAKRTEQGF